MASPATTTTPSPGSTRPGRGVVSLTTNARPAERVTGKDGRAYLLAPVSMIVPGVLPGSKGALAYTSNDTADAAPTWNGIPLTHGHPSDPLSGRPQSADEPGVLDRIGLGRVWNVVFTDKLRGIAHFDEERTQRIAPAIHAKLLAGLPVELSTGLYTNNVECKTGCQMNGREFTHWARDHAPDHLAILENEVGACSLKDGCGVLINSNPEGHNQYTNIGTGEDLHHAIRAEQEITQGIASSRYESNHPMHSKEAQQKFKEHADREQVRVEKIREAIAEAHAKGITPDDGWKPVVSTDKTVHDEAAGGKHHMFNVEHAGEKYQIHVVPQKGKTKDGYDVTISQPGKKPQKLTSVSKSTSKAWVKGEVERVMAKGAKVTPVINSSTPPKPKPPTKPPCPPGGT